MTLGPNKYHRLQTTRDNLRGIRHRASPSLDRAALRRSYGFYMCKVMEDLCDCIDVIYIRNDDKTNLTDHRVDAQNELDTTVDSDGDSLLHLAIILNQAETAMALISQAPSSLFISQQNALYQSPLHLSALTNQPEICRMLLAAGAEVESRDKDGNTPLHIACRDGKMNIIACLMESNTFTRNNVRALNKVQDLSIRNYSGYTCLHLAAMNDNTDVIGTLIQNGADINMAEGKAGRTILHDACIRGDIKLVKTLLRYKSCNINARAYDASTPFDLARDRGHELVCMTLAAAGARQGDTFEDSD